MVNSFYNSLPDTIGGLIKAAAIPTRDFDMSSISNPDTGTPEKSCGITPNPNGPYGEIMASFSNSGGCDMNSKVSFLSYEEWQGGLTSNSTYPPAGSIGYSFCNTRYGAVGCDATGIDQATDELVTAVNKFTRETLRNPYYPWLRSPMAGSNSSGWRVSATSESDSVGVSVGTSVVGVLPLLWLDSSISTPDSGSGTYKDPFIIDTTDFCDLQENQNLFISS